MYIIIVCRKSYSYYFAFNFFLLIQLTQNFDFSISLEDFMSFGTHFPSIFIFFEIEKFMQFNWLNIILSPLELFNQ
eukprot:snap_masked-scaffold_15-processed-gene-5.26-mRNA-1 protein AED:1.00 eAED:1.00 QI:0/0/0/0/1/1/3/0/75